MTTRRPHPGDKWTSRELASMTDEPAAGRMNHPTGAPKPAEPTGEPTEPRFMTHTAEEWHAAFIEAKREAAESRAEVERLRSMFEHIKNPVMLRASLANVEENAALRDRVRHLEFTLRNVIPRDEHEQADIDRALASEPQSSEGGEP